jgi:hypothetical protein
MKNIIFFVTLLSLVAVGGAFAITNPNEEDYADFLSTTMADRVQSSLCQPEGLSEWLGRVGEALSQACEGIVAGSESLTDEEIQQLIVDNTDYKNRILFSTYVTETPFGNYRAIGYLNRFTVREQQNNAQENQN